MSGEFFLHFNSNEYTNFTLQFSVAVVNNLFYYSLTTNIF